MADMDSTKQSVPPRSPRFDSPEQEVFLNLWRTYDRLKAIEDAVLSRHSLSAHQYNALRILRSIHPAAMPTLALGRRLISRGPDTSRMVDRLAVRGLVERQRSTHSRRVVEVAIAGEGLKLLNGMADEVREMHRRQLGHMNKRDQKALVKLLKSARLPHEDGSCDWIDS